MSIHVHVPLELNNQLFNVNCLANCAYPDQSVPVVVLSELALLRCFRNKITEGKSSVISTAV